jgi:hypothetical protein
MERKASLRHRHLLLLGMHLGVAVAFGETLKGQDFSLKRWLIGRHATLAGVPAAAWEPVTRAPDGATGSERLANYMSALAALESTIARLPPLP